MKPTKNAGETKKPAAKEESPVIGGMPYGKSPKPHADVIVESGGFQEDVIVIREKTHDELIYNKKSPASPPSLLPSATGPVLPALRRRKAPRKPRKDVSKHVYVPYTNDHITDIVDQPAEQPKLETPTPARKEAKSLDALMGAVPKDATLLELAPMLADVSREFRQQVAERLEPALNAHIQAMPHDHLDGKKQVCEFVEKTLAPLGLAVKVPNTPGQPGKLKATTGNWPGVGRFVFEVYSDGKQKRPAVSDTLPSLELIDVATTIEPEVAWQQKVGPKSSRTGRKRS